MRNRLLLQYTVMRMLLLFGCLLALWLVGLRDPTWLLLGTAATSITLSFFLLRGHREQLARQLADRVRGGLPTEPLTGATEDATAEDNEIIGDVGDSDVNDGDPRPDRSARQ